jgi:hypothetical protein
MASWYDPTAPIILHACRMHGPHSVEKISPESLDKWVATIASVNALVRRKLYV